MFSQYIFFSHVRNLFNFPYIHQTLQFYSYLVRISITWFKYNFIAILLSMLKISKIPPFFYSNMSTNWIKKFEPPMHSFLLWKCMQICAFLMRSFLFAYLNITQYKTIVHVLWLMYWDKKKKTEKVRWYLQVTIFTPK